MTRFTLPWISIGLLVVTKPLARLSRSPVDNPAGEISAALSRDTAIAWRQVMLKQIMGALPVMIIGVICYAVLDAFSGLLARNLSDGLAVVIWIAIVFVARDMITYLVFMAQSIRQPIPTNLRWLKPTLANDLTVGGLTTFCVLALR